MSQNDNVDVAEFCGNCGSPRTQEGRFCVTCGASMTPPSTAGPSHAAAVDPSHEVSGEVSGEAITLDGKVVGIALAAGALAILLWFVFGATSLLMDLLLAMYVLVVAVSGELRPDADAVLGSLRRLDVMRRGADVVGRLGLVAAVAFVPLGAGLVSVTASGLHHTSPSDVCEAYIAFVEESNKPLEIGEVGDDSEWFKKLAELGKVAEDFQGSSQQETASTQASGREVSDVAKGHGTGVLVSASPEEADRAAAPLSGYCTEGD